MAYPWTVVGTLFNARYGLFRPKKKQMTSALRPKNFSETFQPYAHIKIFKTILLREDLVKGIRCINSLNGFKKTHQKQHLHPELDVLN
jgi:hypothetical protein